MSSRSVELLHVYPGVGRDRLLREMKICKHAFWEYPQDSPRLMLVNDHRLQRTDRWRMAALVGLASAFLELDFVTFCTDLRRYTDAWLALQGNADELRREMKRNANMPQSSHYAAIWYLARAGAFPTSELFMPVSVRAAFGRIDPVAPRLVSVLSKELEETEDRVDREILAHTNFPIRIERVYYDPEEDTH